MPRMSYLAAAAVVGVVAVGGLLLANRPGEATIGAASPSPRPSTTVASPSPIAEAGIPTELQYRWIGEPREVSGRGMSSRTGLNFSGDGFYVSGTNYVTSGLMPSNASLTAPGEITLVTPDAGDGLCTGGDTGVYAYVLSPGGTMLTVSERSETCTPRAAAVTGDWFRVACKSVENACWGELEAGTYPSQYVAPKLDPGEAWEVPFGALTFTVPDGWSNSEDWPDRFVLTPTAEYAQWTPDGQPDGDYHGIYLYGQPAALTQIASCANVEQTDVARTPAGLAAWIVSQQSVEATEPTPITIDGHAGLWLDARIADDWTGRCPDTTVPTAVLLTKASGGPDGWSWGMSGAERVRFILLDLGDGDTVMFAIDSTDPDRFDDLVAQAMPIIESFRFK
jgi:hypothetical protein